MTIEFIKGIMVDLVETITHAIVEIGEGVVPVAFVFYQDGRLDVNGMLLDNPEAKQKILGHMAKQSLRPEIRAVGLLLDSYVGVVSSREEIDILDAQGGLENAPDAKEAILLTVLERDSIVALGSQSYERILLPSDDGDKLKASIVWHPWDWRDLKNHPVERGY